MSIEAIITKDHEVRWRQIVSNLTIGTEEFDFNKERLLTQNKINYFSTIMCLAEVACDYFGVEHSKHVSEIFAEYVLAMSVIDDEIDELTIPEKSKSLSDIQELLYLNETKPQTPGQEIFYNLLKKIDSKISFALIPHTERLISLEQKNLTVKTGHDAYKLRTESGANVFENLAYFAGHTKKNAPFRQFCRDLGTALNLLDDLTDMEIDRKQGIITPLTGEEPLTKRELQLRSQEFIIKTKDAMLNFNGKYKSGAMLEKIVYAFYQSREIVNNKKLI
jgi:hypothetical protein